jgi:hypothetical protein
VVWLLPHPHTPLASRRFTVVDAVPTRARARLLRDAIHARAEKCLLLLVWHALVEDGVSPMSEMCADRDGGVCTSVLSRKVFVASTFIDLWHRASLKLYSCIDATQPCANVITQSDVLLAWSKVDSSYFRCIGPVIG